MISSSRQRSDIIYFDNAATSFPKPESVIAAVVDFMTRIGGNPGRSGHTLSIEAGEAVFGARESLSGMFGVKNIMKVIFTSNATEALNIAILGLLENGDRAVTTSMEHNSVIRPLKELEASGKISLEILECDAHGKIDLDRLDDSLKKGVKLAAINHASNAFGTVQEIHAIAEICRRRGVIMIADCAQSAGIIDINLERDKIDMIAIAGHKSLLGPAGTGALVISDEFDAKRIRPLKFGGTGSHSDKIFQPGFIPDMFESGTLNTSGLSGLAAGIKYISEYGIERQFIHKRELVNSFVSMCRKSIPRYIDYADPEDILTGTVSFNIDGASPSDVSDTLAEKYRIMSRPGLQCAPLAHRTFGTFPEGTVRFSFGIFNTSDDVNKAVAALEEISA